MSTPDRSEGPVPAWQPAHPPALRTGDVWGDAPAESGPPPAKLFSGKIILRAARRHWWQILLLWGVLSAGLMALAYNKIKVSYDATAWLLVRPNTGKIFSGGSADQGDFSRYLKTQVELVTSPDVLGATLAKHPEMAELPSLKGAEDPEGEIRKMLRVQIRPDTNLITVSTSSESREEALAVVNAVVENFLHAANTWSSEETQDQIKRLAEEKRKVEVNVDAKKQKLRNLVRKIGEPNPENLKDQNRLSMERFHSFLNHLDQVRVRRIELEAELESMRMRVGRVGAKAPQQDGLELVRQAWLHDPDVAALQSQLDAAKRSYSNATRLAKSKNDPTVVQARKREKELKDKLDESWRQKAPVLQKSMAQETTDDNEKLVQELEGQVAAAKNMEASLQDSIQRMEVENKAAGGDTLEVEFLRAELDSDKRLLLSISNYVNQLEYDTKGPAKVDRANQKTLVNPSTNKRLKVVAATPFGVFALVLALFVMVEIRSGRVADPDDLPSRVRVEVIAVVPPLPSLRPARALWGNRDELRTRRQLEEFVQSLDHLRVALCSGRNGQDSKRCVVITSACSSEGKTTLAAHLAGRCANAGLSTLLIDADLRNPSLSRLLKVPDGPGLTDVLRGEVSAEAAMMVIEPGGGFHLLPAGTPGYDPSRLLQGDQLASLIGQFRQAFDIVIMDAPPVLLVPDALTVGRWADGALLAVRYDTSRFPLVERAHRRLAAVGVPVIGAVVNGVRSMESSYGYYSYAYHYGRSAPASATIDVPAEPTA